MRTSPLNAYMSPGINDLSPKCYYTIFIVFRSTSLLVSCYMFVAKYTILCPMLYDNRSQLKNPLYHNYDVIITGAHYGQ